MYRIMKDNVAIAIVEQPVFIRKHTNGAFVQAELANAQGIAVKGVPYNLLGADSLDDSLAVVWLAEINGGEYILEQQTTIDGLILTILEG